MVGSLSPTIFTIIKTEIFDRSEIAFISLKLIICHEDYLYINPLIVINFFVVLQKKRNNYNCWHGRQYQRNFGESNKQ